MLGSALILSRIARCRADHHASPSLSAGVVASPPSVASACARTSVEVSQVERTRSTTAMVVAGLVEKSLGLSWFIALCPQQAMCAQWSMGQEARHKGAAPARSQEPYSPPRLPELLFCCRLVVESFWRPPEAESDKQKDMSIDRRRSRLLHCDDASSTRPDPHA